MRLNRDARKRLATVILVVFGIAVVVGLIAYYMYNAAYFWQLMGVVGVLGGISLVGFAVIWSIGELRDW